MSIKLTAQQKSKPIYTAADIYTIMERILPWQKLSVRVYSNLLGRFDEVIR